MSREEERDPQSQNLVRQLFSVSTLHPLVLTLVLHLAQNWCGLNVIVFKETFSPSSIVSLIYNRVLDKFDVIANVYSILRSCCGSCRIPPPPTT